MNDCYSKNCKSKNCSISDSCVKQENLKIILVGNPNVGKSTIFNALSSFYVEVSNFPGTTVDVSRAYIDLGEVIDTPGAYSIGNYNDNEAVTQKIIKTADIVINIVSAVSLHRDLFLTQQLIDMGFPVIVAVNQTDEAEKRNIKINFEQMEKDLGVKVIPTIAIYKQGINDVLKAIKNKDYKASQNKTGVIKELLKDEKLTRCDIFNKLTKLEGKDSTDNELKEKIFTERRKQVNSLIENIVSEEESKFRFSIFFSNLLLNPAFGLLFAFCILWMLYQFLGVIVAGNLVDYISTAVATNYTPWINETITNFIPFKLANELLVGEFGLLTMSVELILGVILPLIISFYLFMAILEDSGYLPRLAVLTDNILSKFGMNGRAVIPLILGFGCCTMGIITTRILGSNKEKIIASAILGLTIPCSAQIGIIIALMASIGGFGAWILYVLTLFIAMVTTGTILNKLVKGCSSDLIIDLPPLRMPIIENALNKTFFRIVDFLKEVTPMFLIGSIVITTLNITGMLSFIQKAFAPVVVYLLKLPEEFSNALIMGMIRRDFGAAGILDMIGGLDSAQVFVAAVVVTLFVPCFAALIVIFKERGWVEATMIWTGSLILSIFIGTILAQIIPIII